jgi:ABC-type lipoprotein release transport system permease subunit
MLKNTTKNITKKVKWYSNPYQNEIWGASAKTMKEKEEIDNEIFYFMSKIIAILFTLGIIYLLFTDKINFW